MGLLPSPPAIEAARERLGARIVETPVRRWWGDELPALIGGEVLLKLELLQRTGTFKPRGALTVMLALGEAERGRGVTAVSAGNHAIAVAYAARLLGTGAKVVMPKSASPFRIERCRRLGATVVLCADIAEAFARVRAIEAEEGRTVVHPFEGPLTVLGNATLGLELARQAEGLDAVIVPIGGGGLAAGIAAALRQLQPACRVFGVEPEGAASMSESLAAGAPVALERVATIADSLGAPYALPHTFAICRETLEEVVRVDDQALCDAMALMFRDLKLAVEPAGAAAAAALLGPLHARLAGRRVALIVCGSNIDPPTYSRHLAAARPPDLAAGTAFALS
jgi:threonine dehydratase